MGLTIALVGCGAIGSALLKGWITQVDSHNRFKSFWVITPHRNHVDPFLSDERVKWFPSPDLLSSSPDVIVFAIKPYQLEEALPSFRHFTSLIITVASGKSLAFYETHLSNKHSIIRAMPNTPVSIHEGVIGLLPNKQVTPQQKRLVETCFDGLGYCPWLISDDEVDKITALSGSGPAYVFYMIESLTKAAESLGFNKETALNLALHTFAGASLYALNSEMPPEELRARVTSPQGTTAAALEVLTNREFTQLIETAVKAAFKRAKELAE